MTDALKVIDVQVDGITTVPCPPVSSRVFHIDEEMTSAKTPATAHPIQLISAMTTQHKPAPPTTQLPVVNGGMPGGLLVRFFLKRFK